MYSFEYYKAMKILSSNNQSDWELSSACQYIRKSTETRNASNLIDAELNLRDILKRRYKTY